MRTKRVAKKYVTEVEWGTREILFDDAINKIGTKIGFPIFNKWGRPPSKVSSPITLILKI